MQPTEDERVLAALSHASIVANIANLTGMIGTTLIWVKQRERSTYVRAHALQALIYQGLMLVMTIFLVLCWGVCLALSLLPVVLRPDLYRSSPPGIAVAVGVLGLIAIIGFGLLGMLYGLYAGYQAYRGRPFHYPLVGRIARSTLQPQPVGTPTAHDPSAPEAPVVPPVPGPVDSEPPTAPTKQAESPTPPDNTDSATAPNRRRRPPTNDGET